MKLPDLFHLKPDRPTPIDFSIPRRCVYRRFSEEPGPCPQCGEMLHQRTQAYLVATRRGVQLTDTYVMSNDAGWFCAACPTVVINAEELGDTLAFPKSGWDSGAEFAVLGIIDLDAIPPEQAHLPFDQIDPLPLVPFDTPSARRATKKAKRAKAGKKPARKKKRRR